MAQERLVAVSYPADEEFARINSEVLAGDAEVVYSFELDDAGRRQTLRRAEALLAWELAKEIPAGALGGAHGSGSSSCFQLVLTGSTSRRCRTG